LLRLTQSLSELRERPYDQNYKVIIDSPIGSGIKFDLLKGWTIDVSGIKGNEIIAVEAKNDLGAQTILQAISQAEMYKNACTRVFIAFPQADLKENQVILQDIQRLCQARGIGLLSVGKICEEIVPAAKRLTSNTTRISYVNSVVCSRR